MASVLESLHGKWIFKRRIDVLTSWFSSLIPENSSILDVGSGDGSLASELVRRRPDVSVEGVDVLVRADTRIPVTEFDGRKLPFSEGSVDCILVVDVLHHTDDPSILLSEARRVSRSLVGLKDHTCDGIMAEQTLRFMDDVGNRRHGVRLPYNYLTKAAWQDLIEDNGLEVVGWEGRLGLNPLPLRPVFERSLHFISMLSVTR